MQRTGSAARLVELDGLRGLAALSVVLFHYTFRYDQLFGERAGLWFRFPAGEAGVMLFFMISGFVILATLERTSHPLEFVYKRFSRLYPAYWAAVAVTFVTVSFCQLPGQQVSAADALCNVTMLQRLLGAEHVDGAYWSLQAELFFYGAALLAWIIVGPARLMPLLFGWMTLGLTAHLLLPLVASHSPGLASVARQISTLANLPYAHLFAAGIALYQWHRGRDRRQVIAVLVLAVMIHTVEHGMAAGLIIAALVALLTAALAGRLPVLACGPLAWLGTLSYSFYLTHQNVGYCLIRELEGRGLNPNLSVATAICLALILAALLTYTIEQPALARLRGNVLSARFARAGRNAQAAI